MLNTKEIVREVCGGFYVSGKSYPGNLPFELTPWYGYCSDGGHCIICCLKQDYQAEGDLIQMLLPVPVKAVLRGYEICREYVVVDLPYSLDFGLVTNPADDEF